MSYSPPFVGPAGLSVPAYPDIVDQMESVFRSVYGQQVYLGNDSWDHQLNANIALMIRDAMQVAQLVYNNRSPATAIGSGLDGVVKLNGLRRKVPSYSTCQVTLAGDPGATVANGIVQDTVFGQKWDLPPSVVIGGGGAATVTAQCEAIGAFQLTPGTLTVIATPQKGWTSAVC